ncbi:MAG TPA: FlgO family outer membrane protein [Candidatus Udaeobacter sp.]|nr:FlgO family outer membrane protein [Candidatus Udaeobacter sp.]
MRGEEMTKLPLEIAHVLFIDIVGYSKLRINQQSELLRELNEIVTGTSQFREADAQGKLIRLPTGDGMALVFRTNPEAPAQCALEISQALKSHPNIQLRMGIHSGPVSEVADVNQRANIAGAGINIAQRVMDCGDAGHILISKHAAEDLEHYEHWRPILHDLGTCEVKHGVRIGVANLYDNEVGNPQLPKKVQATKKRRARVRWAKVAVALLVLGAIVVAFVLLLRRPTYPRLAIAEKSIAVLPFENLSEEKANAFFADGVQDEILMHLAKVADLKVISRMSVMQYKTGVQRNPREIGQQLGVAHLLEGSVQRSANKVRVNAQLIDARTDAHLWAQTYDRDLADVFAIQSEIAKAIADQLQAKLSAYEKTEMEQRPTSNVAAFDDYTRAKTLLLTTGFSWSQEKNYSQAIELLNSAVARDPAFFAAYCHLVFVHDTFYAVLNDHTPARVAMAEAALQSAARLRPDAAETHLARASHLYYSLRDYDGALAELEIARRGLANDSRIFELSGYILRRQGRHEKGLRDLQQAVALDPRNSFLLTQIASSYQYLRQYPEETAMLDRALTIIPDDLAVSSQRALVDLLWKADPHPLHQMIERVRAERRDSIADVADNWLLCALVEGDWPAAEQALVALGSNPFWGDDAIVLQSHFGEGLLARAMRDDVRAGKAFAAARLEQEQIVLKQQQYGPALCVLALIDAALGNKEVALQEGRRAIQLLPVAQDSINGERLLVYFAIIAAWVGEKDLALEQLERVARTPGGSIVASYGLLKLFLFWDPLRGDSRFEQIVASLAPKETSSR